MSDPDTSAFINFVANITSAAATPANRASSPSSVALPNASATWAAPGANVPQLPQRRSPVNKLPPLPSMSPFPSSIQQQQQQQFHFQQQQQPQPIVFNPGLLKIEPGTSFLPSKSSHRHVSQLIPMTVQVKTEPSTKSSPLVPPTSAPALMSRMTLPNIKPMPFHMDKSMMEDDTASKLKQLKKYRESHNEGMVPPCSWVVKFSCL